MTLAALNPNSSSRRRWAFWRSPEDQPTWARPTLLVLALVALVLYTYRTGPYLETYYAAADRSMSLSWHNFFFGSFDPAGTITLDKLPGAFWLQALSIRVFGVHVWAIVLPQILEGVASILVLYRIVRRLVSPLAGVMAAGFLVLSPANVALDRGNIADTLMILCLLLAVDAALSAALTASKWWVIAAGVWVGFAFQAKMIEAWLVLPALWLLVLCASKGSWRTALVKAGALSVVALLVSLSWISLVSIIPAASRPYVDGSSNNSEFHQVFVYNGINRVGELSPNQVLEQTVGLHLPSPPAPSWDRLLRGSIGRDGGWLVPGAALTLLAGLVGTWRRTRGDLWRSAFALWGTWFLVLAVSFSEGSSLNSYYVAALSPAVAGLLATGAALAWGHRRSRAIGAVAMAVIVLTAAYGVALLPGSGIWVGSWIVALTLLFALTATAGIVFIVRRAMLPLAGAVGVVVVCSLLLLPAIASISLTANGLGAFDTPFEHASTATALQSLFGTSGTESILANLESAQNGAPYLMATESSVFAAPFIFESGLEVLPIGGFTGAIPSPTLKHIRLLIQEGKFHLVIASLNSRDPRIEWMTAHCNKVPTPASSGGPGQLKFSILYCRPEA